MGKIELDHTGSGSGITLSSDGTDLLLNGTAIGGGGGAALELYAENPSSPTAPTATGTNSVAIGSDAQATATNGSVALGTSTRASGNANVAIGFQANVAGVGALGAGYTANAGSSFSTALGYNAVTATGSSATALTKSYASGVDSFAAAITSNTSSYGATGSNSVAIGRNAKATAAYATAIGNSVTASQGDGAVALGSSSTASGLGSFAAGYLNIASGSYSQAIGYGANTQSIHGKFAKSSGFFSNYADMQAGILTVVAATTDATPKVLTSDKAAASTNNQVILPNNSAYAFHGTIVARQQASAGTACAAWKIEGLIRREGSAGTTVLVNSATTVLDNTPSWGMALSADTTNGGLAITVTGAAATNIRWVATIHTSEVTY